MRRINSSTALANANGPGRAGFTEGSLAQQIPTTHFTPEWCNSVQEEIALAIEGTGAALNPASNEQLAEAIHGTRVAMYSGPVNSETSFHPPGWGTADILFVNVESGNGEILGLGSFVIKRVKKIYNAGSIPIRILHGSSTADAGRRVYTQHFATVVLPRGASVDVALATPTVGNLVPGGGQAWFAYNDTFPVYNLGLRLGPLSEILYTDVTGTPAPKTRATLLPLYAPGAIDSGSDGFWHTSGSPGADQLFCYGPTVAYKAPIVLPSGAAILGVRALLEKSTGTGTTELRAFKCVADKSNPYSASASTPIGATASISASGRDVATIGSVSEVVDNATTTYHARVLSSSGATGGLADMIHWIEVIWADPGPRSF